MFTATEVDAIRDKLKAAGASKAEIIQAISAACLGWPYVFGAWGCMCTPANRRTYADRCAAKKPEYAEKIRRACQVLNGKKMICDGCQWDGGVRCFDCRGFTHWLLEQVSLQLYGDTVTSQWETKSNWAAQGDIDTMPPDLVCCIFRKGHTGMYLGGGITRHCSTIVKEEPMPGNPKWLRWGIPAGLYSTEELRKAGVNVDESRNIPTIRKGATGELVKVLQNELIMSGYELVVDGVFGKKTEEAVKDFQQKNGLKADGIVGPKTWTALGVDFDEDEPENDNECDPEDPGEDPENWPDYPGEESDDPGEPEESPEKPPDMVSVSRADLEVWADVLEEMARDIREQLE